jgi:hypothetical protein
VEGSASISEISTGIGATSPEAGAVHVASSVRVPRGGTCHQLHKLAMGINSQHRAACGNLFTGICRRHRVGAVVPLKFANMNKSVQ